MDLWRARIEVLADQERLDTKGTKRPKKDVLILLFVYNSQIYQLNGKNKIITETKKGQAL